MHKTLLGLLGFDVTKPKKIKYLRGKALSSFSGNTRFVSISLYGKKIVVLTIGLNVRLVLLSNN
ncbi:MAG: hypothetical protein ACM3P0_15085 [Acidobacteriota bacterium]